MSTTTTVRSRATADPGAAASASPLPLADRLGGVSEYYFSRKLREIGERRAAGEQIVNLGIGNPDLPPPPGVIDALERDLFAAGAHGYQSYRGTDAWRAAIKTWYAGTYGVALADDEFLPLAGSKEAIVHLCLAYLQPGRAALYPDPGYPAYAAATRLAQGTALPYRMPTPGESADAWVDSLREAVAGQDVGLMFANSPHMPTGQVIPAGHLLALIAFAKTHGILLVGDNAYNYYQPGGPGSLLALPGAREVAVELNSLSKSHHLPGWRLGVLAGRADAVAAALQVKSNLDSGQFRPLQHGAAAAVATPWSWHERHLDTIAERRAIGDDLLRDLGCTVPDGQCGLFVWAELPAGQRDAEAFCDGLLDDTGVFFPPGTVFGAAGEGYVRLSLCAPWEVLAQAHRLTRERTRR